VIVLGLRQLLGDLVAGGHVAAGVVDRPLDGGDALPDEMLADRSLVELLQQTVDMLPGCLGNLAKDAGGIGITSLQAVQIEDGDAAKPAHLDREADIDDAVHRRGKDRHGQSQVAEGDAGVDLVRVDGDASGHQGDLVETVGPTSLLEAAELEGLGGRRRDRLDRRTHTHLSAPNGLSNSRGMRVPQNELVSRHYNGTVCE
jgi:hypothetical protein